MATLFGDILSEGLAKAIYLTLFHSLWQGALIAVIAGIIMLTTRKASSARRYNLLLASLLLFIVSIAVTFITESETLLQNQEKGATYSTILTGGERPAATTLRTDFRFGTDSLKAFANEHAVAIVTMWLLVIFFKCLQLFIGLSGTSSLRKKQLFPAGDFWENRFRELAAQAGIKRYIKLAESGLAKVPLTVGYMKPVILIPLGLLAALPQDQIEAILLHELAHIRRKDYLVNILQCLVEILFFFNPAVWWLSSLLRTERENCCDDIAIERAGNRFEYIKALVAFEEYHGQVPRYASAITGSKNHLLNRAKRLIYNHNKTLNSMEKIILTCGLAFTGMLTLAFTQVERHLIQQKPIIISKAAAFKQQQINAESGVSFQDTVKRSTARKTSTINASLNGKTYRILSQDNKIVELYVDNVRIPDDKISDYKDVTDNIFEQSRKSMEMAKESKEMAEHTKELEKQSKVLAKQSKLLAEESRKQADESKLMAKEHKEYAKQSKIYAQDSKEEKERLKMEVKKLDVQIEKLKIQKEKLEKTGTLDKSGEQERRLNRVEYAPRKIELADSRPLKDATLTENAKMRVAPVKPIEPFNYKNDSVSLKPVRPRRSTNSFSQDAVDELMKLGIIKDKHVKFTINNDELVVNGIKQSEEIHQKVLSKMSDKPSGKIEFSYSHE